jgi:hypothetical protein
MGCLLTGTQLPLTTGTAWYFVTCDIVMMVQYTYYAAKDARAARHQRSLQKRARVQAAAHAAGRQLRAYEAVSVSPVAVQTVAERQAVHHVHSAPRALRTQILRLTPDCSVTLRGPDCAAWTAFRLVLHSTGHRTSHT